MIVNPYDLCPCGRSRQFKWCCEPVHADIDRAFQQEANGQHESALRTLDGVIATHPEHPEPLGRKAHLLHDQSRHQEAEVTLRRALDLDPSYPYGLFLQGLFCFEADDLPLAVTYFRNALDAYDPKARQCCQIYTLISESEFRLQRPLAALAALRMALRLQTDQEALLTAHQLMFGPRSPFPVCARSEPGLRAPTRELPSERRQAWDAALEDTDRLSTWVGKLERLTKDHDQDPSAWFNLGLGRAWLGDQTGALAALDRSVQLDTDALRAAHAWTLGEVLRQGHGLEDACDHVEYSLYFHLTDSTALLTLLDAWLRERRLIPFDANPQRQSVTGVVLTPTTAEMSGSDAYLALVGDRLRLWHTNRDTLTAVRDELVRHCDATIVEGNEEQRPAPFKELLAAAFGFPRQCTDAATANALALAHTQHYFEQTWLHRPLKTLNGVAPAEAAHEVCLRKKLLGVIQFMQECAADTPAKEYDFNRLRHKLGLESIAP